MSEHDDIAEAHRLARVDGTPARARGAVVHILAPKAIERAIVRRLCPTCERRTYGLSHDYEWFGASWVCLHCGERWNDGERQERPFARGWRERSKQQARRLWRAETKALKDPA